MVRLPISGEVQRLAALHHQSGYAAHLITVRLLRIAEQIRASNVTVDADLGTAFKICSRRQAPGSLSRNETPLAAFSNWCL
jgi:hypothetical protein